MRSLTYLLLFVLVGVFGLTLVACSKPEPPTPTPVPSPAPQPSSVPTPETREKLKAKISIDYQPLSTDGLNYNYKVILKETNGVDIIFDNIVREFLETDFLMKYDKDKYLHCCL